MGRVAGSYGVRGWIKVAPGGGVAGTLAGMKEWWIGDAPYAIAEARVHSATVI
jgi:ribosomal 30S subunit maturation factor RimM